MNKSIIGLTIGTLVSSATVAAGNDFGASTEHLLRTHSNEEFGIVKPIEASASGTVPRADGHKAGDLIMLAKGLEADILTRQAGNAADMFALWPDGENPTHLIFCIEGDREDLGTPLPGTGGLNKFNPSVQRIEIATGAANTILRGMSACDPVRRTPWGTIVAGEEQSDGAIYEILDPLGTTNHTVTERSLGTVVDPGGNPSAHVAKRAALPTIAWEGIDITPAGVVFAGDELRPGTGAAGKDGGSLYKFIPSVAHSGGEITSLDGSPFAAGSVYAYRASCTTGVQYGQGCEIGNGTWVGVTAASARAAADANGATGYCRPEDGHFDPTFAGPGVKFCWNNTGNEGARNWSEVMCLIDEDPLSPATRPVAQRFVEGDPDFNNFDNLAFQPRTGITYVVEDDNNGDIFACLPDGADRDLKSDGCIKILSVKDASAEPTGLAFTADGKTAYLSIQHSNDAACTPGTDCADLDDYPTDDIIRITGFKILPGMIK